MPKKDDLKFTGWKLTISTKFDIHDETVERVKKWAHKTCHMYWIVLERGESGVKHLHALMCRKEEAMKYSLHDHVWKHYVRPFNEECVGVKAVKFDILYNAEWSTWYLSKEEDHELVDKNYDVALESDYYATQEQQAILIRERDINASCDPFYARHKERFLEWNRRDTNGPGVDVGGYNSYPVTTQRCIEYFYWRMFVDKSMKVISDARRVRWLGRALERYVTADNVADFEDRKFCASLNGPVFDFSG